MSLKFRYSDGVYEMAPGVNDDEQAVAIRQDALAELVALREMADLETGIVVADAPPDDDPRWAKIDALPAHTLHGFYNQAGQKLTESVHLPLDSPERLAARQAYYHAYRLHILARYRRPLDFLVEPGSFAAEDACVA